MLAAGGLRQVRLAVRREARRPTLIGFRLRDGDIFGGSQPFSRAVQFRRGPDGEVGGFTLSGGRVLNHRFLRVEQPMPGGERPDA